LECGGPAAAGCDAAFGKTRRAVPPYGCYRIPKRFSFRDFRVFRGQKIEVTTKEVNYE
jgi:hypothetical protein